MAGVEVKSVIPPELKEQMEQLRAQKAKEKVSEKDVCSKIFKMLLDSKEDVVVVRLKEVDRNFYKKMSTVGRNQGLRGLLIGQILPLCPWHL